MVLLKLNKLSSRYRDGVFSTAVEAHGINSFWFIGQVEITFDGKKGEECVPCARATAALSLEPPAASSTACITQLYFLFRNCECS